VLGPRRCMERAAAGCCPGRYASRFSVRALDLTVDSSLLWVGAALAVVAAVILAFVPRLPSADTSNGHSLSSGTARITGSTSRRQRIFAVTQIAASFVLLAGASTVVTTLIALQTAQTGLDMRRVLTINVPAMSYGKTPGQVVDFYRESIRRIDALPGVNKTAFGMVVPWRDTGFGLQFSADGHVHTPERILAPSCASSLQDSLHRSACPSSAAEISTIPTAKKVKSPSLSSVRLSQSGCSLIRMLSIGTSIGRTPCSNSPPD